MEKSAQWVIEAECRAILADYAIAVDRGDGAAMAAMFTSDGVLRRSDTVLTGPAEIPKILGTRPDDLVMRHLVTTISVDVRDANYATAVAYYMVYNARGSSLPLAMAQPFSIGEWHCAFANTPAGWRLSSFEIKRIFVRDVPKI
jgi:hypothetical protein